MTLFIGIERSSCEDVVETKTEREKKKGEKKKRVTTTFLKKKNIFKIWKESAPDDALFLQSVLSPMLPRTTVRRG